MEVFDGYKLYKATGWFSKVCEDLVKKLAEVGLCIVEIKEVEALKRQEDDLK